MRSPIEHQWNKCYSIGTNRTNRTSGQVECTPTQTKADRDILSPHNKMHFTNRTPMEYMLFHWYQGYQSDQWTSRMHPHTAWSMSCIPPIEHRWNKCYSIGTNRTDRTNRQVECTPTQPEDNGNILSSYTPTDNEISFTNGIPIE